jgi:uncharacterized coiled-coil protein SlyX
MTRYSDSESDIEANFSTDNDSNNDNKEIQSKKITKRTMTKINKNLHKSDIRNIIFEKINDEYSYGKYGPFNVIMMNNNGYVNATKLCQLDETKKFKNWKANKASESLIKGMSKLLHMKESELIICISGGGSNTKISGTYVHPDLIIDIASWISLKFKLLVSEIVKERFAENVNKVKEALEEECKKKDDKIDKLSKEVKKQTAIMEKQSAKMDKLLEQNTDLKDDVKGLRKDNQKLSRSQEKILHNVREICKNQVVLTGNQGDDNHLLILKNNGGPKDFQYTVLKIQKNNMKTQIAAKGRTYPDCEVILDIINPNARTLWKNIKKRLSKKIKCNNCSFNLKKNYNQAAFIKDIKKIHNERLEHGLDSDDDDDDDEDDDSSNSDSD